MRTKVLATDLVKASKHVVGSAKIVNRTFAQDGSFNDVEIGLYTRAYQDNFIATTAGGNLVGEFATRSKALHATRDAFIAENSDTPATESLADAAARLCPNAANQIAALRKRISRGSVQTVEVDGETRVLV